MFKSLGLQLSVLALVALLVSTDAMADVVFTVDISDPNAVTFATTDAFAEGTFDGDSANGITLKDFLVGNTVPLQGQTISGSSLGVISSADGNQREIMTGLWIANFVGGFTPNDVSFFDRLSFSNDIFSFDNQRALTGSAVVDLSPFGPLPDVGMIGNVYFDNPDRNQIIGQWQVVGVPEPTSTIPLAIATMLLIRRRR